MKKILKIIMLCVFSVSYSCSFNSVRKLKLSTISSKKESKSFIKKIKYRNTKKGFEKFIVDFYSNKEIRELSMTDSILIESLTDDYNSFDTTYWNRKEAVEYEFFNDKELTYKIFEFDEDSIQYIANILDTGYAVIYFFKRNQSSWILYAFRDQSM